MEHPGGFRCVGNSDGEAEREGWERVREQWGTPFLEAAGWNWDGQICGCMPGDLECSDGQGKPKNVQRLFQTVMFCLPSPSLPNMGKSSQN